MVKKINISTLLFLPCFLAMMVSLSGLNSPVPGNITKPYSTSAICTEADKADSLTGFDIQMYDLTWLLMIKLTI